MQSFLFDQLFYIGTWHPIFLIMLFAFGFYLAELSFKKALVIHPIHHFKTGKRLFNSSFGASLSFLITYALNFNFIFYLTFCIFVPSILVSKTYHQAQNGY